MIKKNKNEIDVNVQVKFIGEQKEFQVEEYFFGYKIQIKNLGKRDVQLISRHWVVTDSNGDITHIHGDGVIGIQPEIFAGESFVYESWTKIKSPMGTMHGDYSMKYLDDNSSLKVDIPTFALNVPYRIN